MPEERASAYSGNKRPHNQLGLVPVKKLKSELSTRNHWLIYRHQTRPGLEIQLDPRTRKQIEFQLIFKTELEARFFLASFSDRNQKLEILSSSPKTRQIFQKSQIFFLIFLINYFYNQKSNMFILFSFINHRWALQAFGLKAKAKAVNFLN